MLLAVSGISCKTDQLNPFFTDLEGAHVAADVISAAPVWLTDVFHSDTYIYLIICGFTPCVCVLIRVKTAFYHK